jgi:tRNA A-37 threonylcarbamoyl transferase component Bud32
MRRSVSASGVRKLHRWSLTRRLSYDENLPAHLAAALWQGEADRLLFSSVPLQVKDRCVVARHDSAHGRLLVKRHTWGGIGRTLRSVWREASARHCARLAAFLAERGIPTPRPRACLEHCIGPLGYRSYILTDYVEGMDLYRYIRYSEPSLAELRHVGRQVALIWQRLVELGVSHNDMKPENFIVDRQLGVWLIDFEKARRGGLDRRQRRRHIADVKNFLHIRCWHRQSAARQSFLDEFLRTPYGEWLCEPVLETSLEVDASLSVVILCERGASPATAHSAADSVRDIADEIVLVAPAEGGRCDVIDRVEPCGRVNTAPEWKLVLHHDEAVTPVLAKELRQRIAHRHVADAFRLPIDPQFFGRTVPRVESSDAQPIRLFRQDRCSYSLANCMLTISVNPDRTDELSGRIAKRVSPSVADFVNRLNERTTIAATHRFQKGEPPRLALGVLRATAQFLRMYVWRAGFRGGWTGLQMAFLEAVFTWVEEAKLRQLAGEFFSEAAPPSGVEESKAAFGQPHLAEQRADAA